MFDKNSEITFPTFYLIEFLRQSLEYGSGKMPEDQYEMLSELTTFLGMDEDVLPGLEQLAQYKGTNDLSIFLFDLTERSNDYPPQKSLASLSSLAEDFINLYKLMMEEKESVRDLGIVLEFFRAQVPVSDKGVTIPKELQLDREELSFVEFYQNEIMRYFNLAIETLPQQNQNEYTSLFEVFNDFEVDEQEYEPRILEISQSIQQLTTEADSEGYSLLNRRIQQLLEQFEELHTKDSALYQEILQTRKIPVVSGQSEEPLTVDSLLRDYFLSEVEEHVQSIEAAIEESDTVTVFEDMLRSFKSLKEISMIHGYTGIEYFSEQMLFSLSSARDKQFELTEESKSVLQKINAELLELDHYKDSTQIDKIKSLIADLNETLQAKERIDEIAFDDRESLVAILKDVLAKIFNRIWQEHNNFETQESRQKIEMLLNRAGGACELLYPDSKQSVFVPMLSYYQKLAKKESADIEHGLEKVEQVGRLALDLFHDDRDFFELADFLKQAIALDQVEVFDLSNEQKIRGVLITVMRALWQPLMDRLGPALSDNNLEAKAVLQKYLNHFESNIRLTGYESYQAVIDFFRHLIEEQSALKLELVEEIKQSFELTLDRLLSAGKKADYSDILEILAEVLQPETQEPPEEVPVEKEVEEEDELEQDFRLESAQQLVLVRKALDNLNEDNNDRQLLRMVGTGIHAIRSSAHLLNKDTVADFSVNIEEAAEMFEPIEVAIPEDFFPVFEQALNELESLVLGQELNTSDTELKIDNLLNTLIVEEAVPDELLEIEPEQEPQDDKMEETEKPLFSEEDFDDELLDIFREESENFISILQEKNTILKDELTNEQALNDLEYAAHSLRSAAKMLGFREISQLTAGLEDLVESIKIGEIQNSVELQEHVTKTVDMIQRLRDGEKISATELASAVNLLDVSRQKIEPPVKEEPTREKTSDKTYMTDIFLDEAEEIITRLNRDLIDLEQMPESATLLTEIFRNLHTLKGSAKMVEFNKIGGLTHKLEDYFQVYKEQNGEVKLKMLSPAFTALDLIQELAQSLSEGQGEEAAQFTARLAEIDNKLFFYQNFDSDFSTDQFEPTAKKTETPIAGRRKQNENIIKINTDYLDKLVNMATELVVNRTELTGHFDNLKDLMESIGRGKKQLHQAQNHLDDLIEDEPLQDTGSDAAETIDDEGDIGLKHVSKNFKGVSEAIDKVTSELNKLTYGFEKNIQQISNLSKTLHKDILQVRMVPVEYLFDRFPRPTRDLAREQGKRVTVSIEGNNTDMDRAIVEALSDPILHILRNAVDHGIEPGEERKKINKPKTGKITLRARQEKSQVVIDIADDGRGIDLTKVKNKAVRLGLATKQEVKKLNEAEILDFIFYPEFSTRDKATEISGRGVGLDVVANQIQKLKGVIRILTEKNIGTTFSIRVPLTLIISQALMTRIHKHSIAIPMIAVQESIEIDSKDILLDDKRRYVQAHGKLLPFITIDEILKFQDKETEEHEKIQILILHDAGISVALGIGQITGRQEIVIKALGSSLQNVEFIAGGTILGNGEVALILDYAAVIRAIEFQFFGNRRESRSVNLNGKKKTVANRMELQSEKADVDLNKSIPVKHISDRKPIILIVDDSSSVRNFVGMALEKQGFITLSANDGIEALEVLDKESVDLMITDLEMPKMDGFKLIEQIRGKSKLDTLPIVILTGRTGKAQRDKGSKLGANSFIGKPFKEGDLLKVISDFIKV